MRLLSGLNVSGIKTSQTNFAEKFRQMLQFSSAITLSIALEDDSGSGFNSSETSGAEIRNLGLMSTLSRRDRILATRRLDTKAAVIFQDFSLVHSQQETFKALQLQTRALPEVSNKLHAMANKLEQVGNQLITTQDRFHASIGLVFSELAVSMDKTHKESLEQNIRLALLF